MAIITISRGTFSGGQALAQCVAEKLGYSCISRQVLVNAASKYGVPLEKLSSALVEPPSFWERFSQERARFLSYIQAALAKEVKNNNIVYHGLAGHLLLEGLPVILKVRVIANMDFRILGAMEHKKFTKTQEAIDYIKKMDEQRTRWTRFLYHVDWTDPSLYDVIVNLNCISLDSACDVVCHAAELSEFRTTPETQKIINNLVLGTEVRAIIASESESKGINDAKIEIKAEEGVITIGGSIDSLEDADKIREIIRTVPGVTGISSKMQLKHYWG